MPYNLQFSLCISVCQMEGAFLWIRHEEVGNSIYNNQGSHSHGKAWKSMEKNLVMEKSWKMGEKNKVMEIQKGHGKVMEFLHCL